MYVHILAQRETYFLVINGKENWNGRKIRVKNYNSGEINKIFIRRIKDFPWCYIYHTDIFFLDELFLTLC